MLPLRDLPRVEVLEEDARRYSSLEPAALLAFLSVLVVGAEVERLVEPHFTRYGLSQARFVVLMALRRRDGHAATPAELAAHAAVTRATMTGLLDGLEGDGLVERSSRKDDRRSTNVRLTRKGLQLLEKILPDHYGRIAELMKPLTKPEKKQLTALLGKMREGIAAARDAAGA